MKIVRMQECHLHALARIEKQCFGAPWSEDGLREELTNPIAFFLVAQEDSILGYIGCHIILDEGYITNVAVALEHRHQGVGYRLVHSLLQYAYSKKITFMTLEARVSNLPAILLYKKAGFETIGYRKQYYAAPREDAMIMTWFSEKHPQ